MKVIIDGMGGDNAPAAIIEGTIDAIKEYNINAIIVGKKEIIEKELIKYDYPKEKLQVMNANETISNDDEPASAIRRKKESSMVIGLQALKDGKGDTFISAGSTGALLAGGLLIIKRLKGIKRAALGIGYPNMKGGISLLIDGGANADCKPEYLEQFGIMGSIYMENIMEIENPKVGLVNIGTEVTKGNQLTKEAYPLLEKASINFIGNVEGRSLLNGDIDVIVCDGFVGNIILKVTEGVAIEIFSKIKKTFMSSLKSKIGALLVKPGLESLKGQLDYREHGGAPLLGIRKPVIKAHGSSDALAVKNAIRQSINFIEKDVISIIDSNINLAKDN